MVNDDSTLGGYLSKHTRPPAFAGSDGRAYSADVFVDQPAGPEGQFGAALFFVRWSVEGDRPDGHLETGYVAFGTTPAEAQGAVRELTLRDVKRFLDAAIAEDQRPPAW